MSSTDSRHVSDRIYMDSDTVMASAVNYHTDISQPINLNHLHMGTCVLELRPFHI